MATQREIYDEGYRDGAERWRERCERLQIQLDSLRKHYDYLLNLKADELLLTFPRTLIVKDQPGADPALKEGEGEP